MHKVTKILLVILLVLILIFLLLTNFKKDVLSMSSQVGARLGGGELTVSEYYTLVQCVETYKECIEKKDYELAYYMLGSSYRKYVSLDEFKEKMLDKTADDFVVKNIDIVTLTTFDALVGKSGEEEHYSIIINNDRNTFKLYPESFLDYKELEMKESKRKLKCTLNGYIVNIDKNIFDFTIENTDKNDAITISQAVLYNNLAQKVTNENDITIQPGEVKNITVEFESDYTFPTEVILEREIDSKKTVKYSFELK